jgi:hypothetical protein
MSTRVSFADLLKKGAEKDQQKIVEKPMLATVETINRPTPPTPVTQGTPPTPPTNKIKQPISPEKDFAKVANSIVRDGVAQGLFIGKSKQIYDFLYLQTRGAIQPKRSFRITKTRLMRASDVGSERTLLKNLAHLRAVGFIKITEFDGQHGGNEYEVLLPEESHPTPPTARQSPNPLQKVGTLPPVESGVGGVSQIEENKTIYSSAKTSFKDIKESDDEFALAGFTAKLESVSRKLTNKGLSKIDNEKWSELAELLAMELEIAVARTKSVSNIPAFLTEHLRRRLISKPAALKLASEKFTIDKSHVEVKSSGAESTEEYQAEPLSKEGREAVLKTMQEYLDKGQSEFILSFQNAYTTEDWHWLSKEMKKSHG